MSNISVIGTGSYVPNNIITNDFFINYSRY